MDESEVRLLAAMITATAAIFGMVRKSLMKGLRNLWLKIRSSVVTKGDIQREFRQEIMLVINRIDELRKDMAHVVHETSPNGNTSMKDVLNKVSRDIRTMEAKARAHRDGMETIAGETGPDGELIWSSNSFQDLLQVDEQDVLGSGWMSYIADYDQERVQREWAKAVKERRRFRSRHHMRATNGREFSVELVARPIHDIVTDQFSGWVWRLWERGGTGQQIAVP